MRYATRQVCRIAMIVLSGSLVLGSAALASAGVIEGEEFVLRPWLKTTQYKSGKNGQSSVRLYFQVENPSDVPVKLSTVLQLAWQIQSEATVLGYKSGIGALTCPPSLGAGPQLIVPPHSHVVCPVTQFGPPTTVSVSKGSYVYMLSVVDPYAGNEQLIDSSLRFEVK